MRLSKLCPCFVFVCIHYVCGLAAPALSSLSGWYKGVFAWWHALDIDLFGSPCWYFLAKWCKSILITCHAANWCWNLLDSSIASDRWWPESGISAMADWNAFFTELWIRRKSGWTSTQRSCTSFLTSGQSAPTMSWILISLNLSAANALVNC